MKITDLKTYTTLYKTATSYINNPIIKPQTALERDTVSFQGRRVLKKSDFRPIDLAVIEKFKPNIQKFNTKLDLQVFAKEQTNLILQKNYEGRSETTSAERTKRLKSWFNCICDNSSFSETKKLIILSAITKNLKKNNETQPPLLCTNVLADTLQDLENRLETNPKENFDFLKMYNKRLKMEYEQTEDISLGSKWIIIPSQNKDPQNFEKNYQKFQIFSSNTWCTKGITAKNYLTGNSDAHIFIENGKPKVCIIVEDDKIKELQGKLNDDAIPIKYSAEIFDYIKKNKLSMCKHKSYLLEEAKMESAKYNYCKSTLGDATKLRSIDDIKKVFDALNIRYKVLPNNLLSIKKLTQAGNGFSFKDLGIKENDLFKYIGEIKSDVYFDDFDVTNLGNLEVIQGDVNFAKSKVTDLGNLRKIAGDARFKESEVKSLKNLEYVGINLFLTSSKVSDIGKLKKVDGFVDIRSSLLSKKDFDNVKIKLNLIA